MTEKEEETNLLTIKFAPKKKEELSIHNKKLVELSQWLEYAFPDDSNVPRVLFLTGPTGSGKSTSVEVLCSEADVEVVDYTPELLHNDLLEHESHSLDQLMRFLSRRHASLNKKSSKKILLVSELPDQAYNDAVAFREELTNVFYNLRHPVIFCLTNEISCWHLNPNRIFTEPFLQKNCIDVLTFNPVAVTFMKKALQRASKLLDEPVSEPKLKIIGEEARGDLRMAMNMLQMNSVGPNPNRQCGSKIICAAAANKEEAFHMIGRILYAKRINPNAPNPRSLAGWKSRKSGSVPEPKERTPLEHDPTDIITMSSMDSENLISFLFENEHVFCSDIKKYRQVLETLSACDVMTADFDTKRALPDEYASQMATRSVMWHNYKGARPQTRFAVHRSVMKDLDREIETIRTDLRRLPIVGIKYFSALTAPYVTIIEDIVDPRRPEFFVSRPMNISWKMGREQIEDQMERRYKYLPKVRAKTKGRVVAKKNAEKEQESEEEKYTIEESSDDSFEDF